jgi:acyl carrier protein
MTEGLFNGVRELQQAVEHLLPTVIQSGSTLRDYGIDSWGMLMLVLAMPTILYIILDR